MSKSVFDILLREWQQTADLDEVAAALEGVELVPVDSGNLAAVGYDPNRFELLIAFLDGSIYRYQGVDARTYTSLMRASSHGEYFRAVIRDAYPYERIVG